MNKKMLKLYESEAGRELMILSYLSRSEEFVSIKDISQKSGLTTISVQKYLEKIQGIIEELDEPGMGILIGEQGVQFYTRTIRQYYHLRNHLINSSVTIQLGLALLLGKKIQREQFMMAHFISEATLKRRVKELKVIFLEYNLNLNFRNGFLVLKGDELQIRRLAYEMLTELSLEGDWPFKTIEEGLVRDRIEVYLGMSETPETANLFRRVELDYAIMISRFRNQRPLKLNFSLVEPKLYDAMSQMIPNLSPFPEIPTEHALYFMMTLLSNEEFYHTPNGKKAMKILAESGAELAELVDYSSHEFGRFFEIDTNSLEMQPYLYSIHFEKLFYRYWQGVMHKKKITTPYPMLNRKLIQYVLHLHEKYPDTLHRPLYLLTRKYIVLYGRYRPFSHYEFPIRIYLLDTDFPFQSGLLENMIQQMFLYKYNLVFSTLEEADVVIRTTSASPPPRLAKQEDAVPTYYMNVSKIYQNYAHLDGVFQKLSNEKILAYNEEVYQKEMAKEN